MRRPLLSLIVWTTVLGSVATAPAQEAAGVAWLARRAVVVLGERGVAEYGGEAAVRQVTERLVAEATESGGRAAGHAAEKQLGRVLASDSRDAVLGLRGLRGEAVPLLHGVADEQIPGALMALNRPGVDAGIRALGGKALQEAALAGETRLPGAGLKLVQHYGDEGASLAERLTEDQANSVVAGLRPKAINAMSATDRSNLLNALASRSDARVFTVGGAGSVVEASTAPLAVVASGVVLWHGTDVVFAPGERVIERPDGTVIREKVAVGSKAIDIAPQAARALADLLFWPAVITTAGLTLSAVAVVWRRLGRPRTTSAVNEVADVAEIPRLKGDISAVGHDD